MLRDVEFKDVKDMFEYGKDLEMVKFLSWGLYSDVIEVYGLIREFFLKRFERGLFVGYVIVDLKNDKMIGIIDFYIMIFEGVVEVGFCLNKVYWNKGIMFKLL